MRPLKIKPGHAISGLALSPDGQRLGVVQWDHGFRLFDALAGTELGHDTTQASVYEVSPTGRYSIHAGRGEVRLAEVTAGRPFLKFQTGWTRLGSVNRPPEVPETSPLPRGCSLGSVSYTQRPSRHLFSVSDASLTADHRFAVGRSTDNYAQLIVCDLAHETTIAANLDLSASRSGYESVHTVFTPDEARVVAVTPRTLFVYDLPPPQPLAPDTRAGGGPFRRADGPVLSPVVAFRVTQPQPDPLVPPFAVLPCGTKVLLRGEKSRVELRDLSTGEVLTVWKWGLPKVNALAVAGDGLTAAAGGASGQVVMWDLG